MDRIRLVGYEGTVYDHVAAIRIRKDTALFVYGATREGTIVNKGGTLDNQSKPAVDGPSVAHRRIIDKSAIHHGQVSIIENGTAVRTGGISALFQH